MDFTDASDIVFRATTGKWWAVVVEISRTKKTGQSVLVGTTSVEQSDALCEQLHKLEFHMRVLNAKSENVEREAEIVARSGRFGVSVRLINPGLYRLFAFIVIAASQLQLNISCVLEHLIAGLTTFLRKAIQALIMATLEMLNALIAVNGDNLGSTTYGVIIEELSTVMRYWLARGCTRLKPLHESADSDQEDDDREDDDSRGGRK
ncbi:hypothetical protein OROHE_014237 [Orobanche hederae]